MTHKKQETNPKRSGIEKAQKADLNNKSDRVLEGPDEKYLRKGSQ